MSSSLYALPYFDGKSYAYCKVRMRAFLMFLDKRVWYAMERGWTKFETTLDAWTRDEITNCNWNSKGLNVIFMVVSPEEFKRISMCEIVKEVWNILEVIREGIVKNLKLQMLTLKFEKIKMLKHENFFIIFLAKLNDIVNSSLILARKSLPERFQSKVIDIEESKDLDAITVEELVSSL
ncbi:hypothetical protein I3760_06G052000 [Carya illinoinensis]|nr:hypothetical protein I3760_06G052000 [Carya illinoinensis]